MNMSQASGLPSGPTALLSNAMDLSSPSAHDETASDVAGDTSDTHSSRTGSPDSALGNPTTTTTITTESTRAGGGETQTTTETIESIGAETVAAKFSSDGSFAIRPVAARGLVGKIKTRRTHTFRPRVSAFDRDNPLSQANSFRGFWTLFWIMIFVGAVRTGVHNYQAGGSVWGTQFATMISEDAKMLALSDAIMVSSTFLCVPFVKLLISGLRYYWVGAVIQHILQALFLATAVRWTFAREWPWVQSGFMTLHALAMLMKIHSYLSYNGELSEKSRELKGNETKLNGLVERFGGTAKVEMAAHANWAASKRALSSDMPSLDEKPGSRRRTLEQRKASQSPRRHSASRGRADSSSGPPPSGLDLLSWHSEEQISTLAAESIALKDALISTGTEKVVWPANITYANFCDYLLVPTLVYELEYPRTDKIRPIYILEKTLATFGTFSLLIGIVEHFILPISPGAHNNSFFVTTLDLAVPFMINYLLIFFIIFECVCNGFAEITRFSDREFYQDWWNSTSFDEFSRRWNVPVHAFLLRHVYTSTMTTYRFSKFQAAFTTFLLSACVHELVMAVVTHKVRPYLLGMQMAQLPLIMIGRLPIFREYPALGNLFFWLGLLSGFPLLAVAYIRF